MLTLFGQLAELVVNVVRRQIEDAPQDLIIGSRERLPLDGLSDKQMLLPYDMGLFRLRLRGRFRRRGGLGGRVRVVLLRFRFRRLRRSRLGGRA